MIDPQRYVVFNRDDFMKKLSWYPQVDVLETELSDAVVIRKQDIFAPVVLHTYAHQVEMLLKLSACGDGEASLTAEQRKNLNEIAQYFHLQAQMSEESQSNKLPDF